MARTPFTLPLATNGGFDVIRVALSFGRFYHFAQPGTASPFCGGTGPFEPYRPTRERRLPVCVRCNERFDAAVAAPTTQETPS